MKICDGSLEQGVLGSDVSSHSNLCGTLLTLVDLLIASVGFSLGFLGTGALTSLGAPG